jgi:anti-sigma B factor antagonist
MNIVERTLEDVTVLELDGPLALEGNAEFRKRALAAIEAGNRKLIVNLEQVKYMDSSGLGELIACYTTMRQVSGRLALLHVHQRLQHLLEITKLRSVFEIFDSEPTALASFTQDVKSEVPGDENTARLSQIS